MAAGLPVVGTSQAFEGIAATEEDGIRIANELQRFATELIALLTGNNTLLQQCAFQARRYVEAHHQGSEHGVRLERLLQGVVSAPDWLTKVRRVSLSSPPVKTGSLETAFSRRIVIENTSCLYTTLMQVLRLYSNWLDRRSLKMLAWMMVGLMSLSAWAPYLVSRAQ